MRKLPLLLIAGLAAVAAAPVVVRAKDTAGSGDTAKKPRPFAAEEQAVKDAQKEFADAKKKNDKAAIDTAQKKLADAQKALAEAKKSARGKKPETTAAR